MPAVSRTVSGILEKMGKAKRGKGPLEAREKKLRRS